MVSRVRHICTCSAAGAVDTPILSQDNSGDHLRFLTSVINSIGESSVQRNLYHISSSILLFQAETSFRTSSKNGVSKKKQDFLLHCQRYIKL
jgi:hypothetical protein